MQENVVQLDDDDRSTLNMLLSFACSRLAEKVLCSYATNLIVTK